MADTANAQIDISEIVEAFRELDEALIKKVRGRHVLMDFFGRWIEQWEKDWDKMRLRTGGLFRGLVKWDPVQETYKRKRELGGDVLLKDTGTLRNTVSSGPIGLTDTAIEIGPHGGGVGEVYAVAHNKTRPFMFLTPADADLLKQSYLHEVDRVLKIWSRG